MEKKLRTARTCIVKILGRQCGVSITGASYSRGRKACGKKGPVVAFAWSYYTAYVFLYSALRYGELTEFIIFH